MGINNGSDIKSGSISVLHSSALLKCGRSYQDQFEKSTGIRIEEDEYMTKLCHLAVDDRACFIAKKFIEAENVLKTNRIKRTCESSLAL